MYHEQAHGDPAEPRAGRLCKPFLYRFQMKLGEQQTKGAEPLKRVKEDPLRKRGFDTDDGCQDQKDKRPVLLENSAFT